MARNHVHLAEAEFGKVTSGVRQNCDLYIYIDTARCF
jgi:RNA:NAD 2'-phosphotransferase (TPT1/KptA family)